MKSKFVIFQTSVPKNAVGNNIFFFLQTVQVTVQFVQKQQDLALL